MTPSSSYPLGATAALIEIWRRSVVALFLEKGLRNPDFARKILGWQHAGFSIESGTRILDQPTREALCQYIITLGVPAARGVAPRAVDARLAPRRSCEACPHR
jgi:hypothetical protein